jgi:hypothetical protein
VSESGEKEFGHELEVRTGEEKKANEMKSSKIMNMMGWAGDERRKLSGEYVGNKEKVDNEELCHKSDRASVDSSSEKGKVLMDEPEKKSKGHNYELSEVEGSFWKKIRNLETRLKNINLNYNTMIIKIKKENVRLERENKYYRRYVKEHFPKEEEGIGAEVEWYVG